jgi:putative redox protein
MVAINILYKGELRCEATHGPSGTALITDAPADNHGKAESFSPTDLVATALGTCMLTIMGIAARKMELAIEGTTVVVTKEMATVPVRRIGKLAIEIAVVTPNLSDEQKQKLEQAALTCPVHKSLHPDIQMPIEFRWA